jgi:hypothetical protein
MQIGRPKIEINYDLVEKLSAIFCTQEEIAGVLEVSVRTLQRDDHFCQIYKKGNETAKASLRRNQFKLSQTNATMAIWLGKQYLGQRDIIENFNNDRVIIVNDLESHDQHN